MAAHPKNMSCKPYISDSDGEEGCDNYSTVSSSGSGSTSSTYSTTSEDSGNSGDTVRQDSGQEGKEEETVVDLMPHETIFQFELNFDSNEAAGLFQGAFLLKIWRNFQPESDECYDINVETVDYKGRIRNVRPTIYLKALPDLSAQKVSFQARVGQLDDKYVTKWYKDPNNVKCENLQMWSANYDHNAFRHYYRNNDDFGTSCEREGRLNIVVG